MLKKRGQAGNIATLISLIALFMIIYILLLPQEARDELLNREDGIPQHMTDGISSQILFSKEIGEVSPLKQSRGTIHTISGVNLFSNVESEIITLANNILVNKGIISENSQKLVFYLEYPEDVEKSELYLIIDNAVGNLVVSLNGYEIFNKAVKSNSQELLEMPVGYLRETNTIELSSAAPFLRSSMHELKSVRLRKQVEIKNKQSTRILSIPASEIKDLEKAILSFSVYCSRNEDQLLNLKLNGKLVYSDVPFCNLQRTEIEIDSSFINSGVNELILESEGDYTLEQVEWESLLRGERASEYAFTISDDDYNDVRRGLKDVFVVFDFALSDERKIMEFYVNDKKFDIDTSENSYFMTISDYLEKGGNLIRLRPKNSFEIIEMRVELE
ncbi:MAG: hypothetical protein KKG75_00685 [Nanoarchaeota archaeon]|nr:hypothetical protein [Nanoarchaeota archaeon]